MTPPVAVASAKAEAREREFYAARDAGAVHLLLRRPGDVPRHIAVPTERATFEDVLRVVEKHFAATGGPR